MIEIAMEEERPPPSLYEQDFYSWTQGQGHLLRTLQLRGIDTENIAEEIETLGRTEASALRSTMRLIIMHLLKEAHQPERATRSSRLTIIRERVNLDRILADNPGLKSRLNDLFAEAYADARREAIVETRLPAGTFPKDPELSLQQIRDDAYLPGRLA